MTHLQKLRTLPVLKWVSFTFSENLLESSKIPILGTGSCHISQNPRFYRRKRTTVQTENCENADRANSIVRVSRATWAQAQTALLEYLQSTRSLGFLDAENMSKNSPQFLDKLLKRVEETAAEPSNNDIKHWIARFLRYHPINEFEPFFESLGLEPCEYVPLLPRNLMFLNDDKLLLENYHVLCDYGIARNKIGKIYKEALEVFQYDYGVLKSKLRAYEELGGLGQRFLTKVIVCSPTLLIGDVNSNSAFMEILDKLKNMGLDCCWIEGHLSQKDFYNWRQMLGLLRLFRILGFSEERLVVLIKEHPGLLFEGGSNKMTFSLIGLLVRFGSTGNELLSTFLHFPQIQVGRFILNFRHAIVFLTEIGMEAEEIGRLVRSYPTLLGSCALKKSSSLLSNLKIGKKRLCKIIKDNPQELKNWVLGLRVKLLPPNSEEDLMIPLQQRIKFLLDLGFVKDSKEMKKALKLFRGKGAELQERFDCFVKAGLDRKDACEMVKKAPSALNQSKDVIEMKIDFLVNSLGFPISTLKRFPGYVFYTIQRVKLRISMYNWLKDQGKVGHMFALSTVIASSDARYERSYVKRHPKGPRVWQDLRKQIYSE